MTPHSQQFLQKRRFFMVVPLLVLPFVTMIFWALGGGQGSPVQAKSVDQAGLNLGLPDPHFGKKEIWDKLTLYEMAERDSARFREARENDPYFDLIAFKSRQEQGSEKKTDQQDQEGLIHSFPHKGKPVTDPNEGRVNQKLEELYREINKTSAKPDESKKQEPFSSQASDPGFTADVDRLEKMMEMMQHHEPDPEMQQIAEVLERILDIQHPERVKEKLKTQNQKVIKYTLPVEPANAEDNISLMQPAMFELPAPLPDGDDGFQSLLSAHTYRNGFFGLDESQQLQEGGNALDAVIHDTQELVAGATVKMRLTDDVYINGKRIAKGQFVYGICAINGERLTISVASIRTGNSLLPVALAVYDLDGLEGIYIPGAITRDAAKQASGDVMQNMQLLTLDPSLGAQAASAGIEAAKGLFSKKARLIKVTVKAGYQVLLKDTRPVGDSRAN